MNHPCDGQTDGQTDRQTDRRNCDSICALSIDAVERKNDQRRMSNIYCRICTHARRRHSVTGHKLINAPPHDVIQRLDITSLLMTSVTQRTRTGDPSNQSNGKRISSRQIFTVIRRPRRHVHLVSKSTLRFRPPSPRETRLLATFQCSKQVSK